MRRFSCALALAVLSACSKDKPDRTATSIEVTPASPTVVKGSTTAFAATATYSDGTTADVTGSATWTTDAPALLLVSDEQGTKGQARALAPGGAHVTAAYGGVSGSTAVTVTIAAFRIDPGLLTVSLSGSASLRALARDALGAEEDVTTLASWSSDATGVADVAAGAVTPSSTGVAHLTASYLGNTASSTVVVEDAQLVALRLSSPASVAVGAGFTGEIRAYGLYASGVERDVTAVAMWTSDDSSVVQVSDANGSKGSVHVPTTQTAPSTTANVTASYGGLSATTAFTVTPRQVLWMTIAPVPSPLPVSATYQLRATAVYDDYTVDEVTASAAWSSSDAAVSVSTGGLATASTAGGAILTASYGGCSANTFVTVAGQAPTALLVTLEWSQLWRGERTPVTAKLWYPDGRLWDVTGAATLSTGDAAVAVVETVSQSVRAVGQGQTSVQASFGGMTGSATVTVSEITNLSLAAPSQIPRSATASARAVADGTASFDVTSAAEWSSADPSVLAVSNAAGSKGTLTAIASGTATITARLGGFEASLPITVVGEVLAIAIAPEAPSLNEARAIALTATATVAGGSTVDVTSIASWSSDPETAYVLDGLVYGVHAGTSVVGATLGGIAGYALVTVLPRAPLEVKLHPSQPDPARVPVGFTVRLSAWVRNESHTVRDQRYGVTWTSSDTNVASFSQDPLHAGELTVANAGTTWVGAEYAGVSSVAREVVGDNLVSVSALPATTTVPAGGSIDLPFDAVFDNGTCDLSPLVTWTTTDPDVAYVEGGMLLGMRTGSATVQATLGAQQVSTVVTVEAPSVAAVGIVAPTTLAEGASGAMQAVADLSNLDTVTVTDLATLTTTTPGTLTVTGATVAAGTAGSGTVRADYLGASGTAAIEVVPSVAWLQVEPAEARTAVGTVTCPYVSSAGVPAANVTDLSTYSVSNAAVAQLSGSCVTAGTLGTSVVTASYGTKSAVILFVVDPVAKAPVVEPVSKHDDPVHVYERAGYAARTEPQTVPVTSGAAWASLDEAIVKKVGTGVFEGVAPGWTTATASIAGFSTPFWVRVLPATLDSIELQRWAIAVPAGASYPLVVKGTYSDGVSGVDVTGAAGFTSEDTTVARFDVQGVVRAVAPGTTHVVAQIGLATARIPVTVF